jgi:hypothetical protein
LGEDYEYAPGGIPLPGALNAGHAVPAPTGSVAPSSNSDSEERDYVEPNRLGDRNSIFNLGDNADGFNETPNARPLGPGATPTAGATPTTGPTPTAGATAPHNASGTQRVRGPVLHAAAKAGGRRPSAAANPRERGGAGGRSEGRSGGGKAIKRDVRKQSVYNGFEEEGVEECPV